MIVLLGFTAFGYDERINVIVDVLQRELSVICQQVLVLGPIVDGEDVPSIILGMVAQGVHKGHHILGLEVELVSVTKQGLSALMVE